MKNYKNKKLAFTLVELIVVITILAILGTIGFMSFQGYSSSARDSKRISDLQNIKTSLELFQTKSGKYPIPTGGIVLDYQGAEAWTQGTFGESVYTNVGNLNKLPIDPLTDTQYTYSVTNSKNEYELGAIYENDNLTLNIILDFQANALDSNFVSYVTGTYNGIILKVSTGSTIYTLALPSIISSDLSSPDVVDIVNNYNLVYNGLENLPESYNDNNISDSEINLNLVNAENFVVFSGTLDDFKSEEGQIEFITNLQTAYTGTIISGVDEIGNILSYDINNDLDGCKLLSQILLNQFVDDEIEIGGTSGGSSSPLSIILGTGYNHSCAKLDSGEVYCWGRDNSGQLGNDSLLVTMFTPVLVDLGDKKAVDLYVGGDHSCVEVEGGGIWCWGENGNGQLGNNSTTDSPIPVEVNLGGSVEELELGYMHSCARLSDGTVKCWGRNLYGQLGTGTTLTSTGTPLLVEGISNAIDLDAGYYHNCVLIDGGELKCWGRNYYGQLGISSYVNQSTPTTVSLEGVKQLSLGGQVSCALTNDGDAYCWGEKNKLGTGDTVNKVTPQKISSISGISKIKTGVNHSCAQLETGEVYCWGSNSYGQLGLSEPSLSTIAIEVSQLQGISDFSLGNDQTCVVLNNNIKCLGNNSRGKLGNGTNVSGYELVDVDFQ